MHVALDTHPLYTGRGGVARYVTGLQAGLASACPEVQVAPVAWPVASEGVGSLHRAVNTVYRELLWPRRQGRAQLRASGAELWHSTALPLWPEKRLPHVVTLHDLAPLRHPERYRRWARLRATARLRMAAQARHLICVSQFSADEAMALLGLPANRLTVVPNGVSTLPDGGHPPPGLPAEFFLFVGSLEPGKNLALLAEVWATARSEGRPLPPLWVVGERWTGVAAETAQPEWHYTGHLDDATLAALYRRARALVFPSRYEGFGLPVAEAMAAGCPVVAAPVASLPEVGGDAVLWTPLEAVAWRAALTRLVKDADLVTDLGRAGQARASRFSWQTCARETCAVWRQVLG